MGNSSALTLFTYNSHQVRTILDERTGEPWWVAKDVCDVLGIKWLGQHSLGTIPAHWQGVSYYETPGGVQSFITLSEPAIYKLAFRSRKPEADAFTNWIASEVIPTIRKTGSYSVAPTAPAVPALPQTYAEALRALADSTEKVEALEGELVDASIELDAAYTTLTVVQDRLVAAAPKVEFYDTVAPIRRR